MPGHKGMVSGFVVAGFGSGAAVFNIVAILWVNPNDASPDPTTGYFSEVGRVCGKSLFCTVDVRLHNAN